MNQIMLDLETMGTSADAAIISIGAVRFEIDREIETATPPFTDAIIPDLAARYRAALEDLTGTASRDIAAARQALQAVLGKVSVERADGATIARIRHAYAGISGVDNGGSGGRI